jgi:ATP-binding cassette subfamily C protein
MLLAGAPLLLRDGSLSAGAVVGAAVYLAAGLEPAVRGLVGIVKGPGMELSAGLHEIGQAFPPPAPQAPRRVRTLAAHDLTLHRLTFGYGPQAKPVFKNLNLTLADGGHLAVIGPGGIGKSTLADLLTGLLEPRRGAIRMAGVNLHRIDRADLRRLIALVPREAYVFAGTLRDNLTYLAPAADRHDIDESVAAIGLGPVVERIGGLDAPVGAGGAHLSPGEKQLVALTRVHLSPARIVILDEATAELGPAAEARAEAALAARGGSLVVVAHRIGSALRARSVLLLDGDRVRLSGHAGLLAGSALYADLIERSCRGEQCPVSAET